MTYALSEPLQRAVYDALLSDTALSGLVGANVFDGPLPLEAADLPPDYVTLGGETVKNASNCTNDGAIHDFIVTVHSGAAGFKTSKIIAGAICDVLLDAQLPLSRGQLVYLRFVKARAQSAEAPARRTIALNFRAFVEDTTY